MTSGDEPSTAHRTMSTGTPLIGSIEPFDESISEWMTYEQRVSSYLAVNSIPKELEVHAFITLIGPKTYRLLTDLVAPSEPTAKTIDELKQALRAHLSPKPSVIAERAKFHVRKQNDSETIADFVAALKHLAQTCKFGTSLDETMRDRFVTGLQRMDIQKCLFAEDETLTFKRAVEKALSLEQASKNASSCHEEHNLTAEVQRLQVTRRKTEPPQQKPQRTSCYRCKATAHISKDCPFSSAKCFRCGKKGHIQRACLSKRTVKGMQVRGTAKSFRNLSITSNDCSPIQLNSLEGSIAPICFEVDIEGQKVNMELDTGAAVSVISEENYLRMFSHVSLNCTNVVLRTYTGEMLKPLGVLEVTVEYRGQRYSLPLHVIRDHGPSLIGRDWLQHIKFDWTSVHKLDASKAQENKNCSRAISELCSKYSSLFKGDLGHIKGEVVKLHLKENARPCFLKARPVAFALKPRVEKELKDMEAMGIITPIETSEFATPVVPVVKRNGQIRLCGDYKITINPILDSVQYPLPRIDDLLADLGGGKNFSRIDLSRAYQKLEVDDDSKKYLAINTHLGLYAVNRLPFGITPAPMIFQKVMDSMLKKLPGVTCYLDDILVTGKTDEDHLRNLEAVLKTLLEKGVRVQRDKCDFFKPRLEYLGHLIDSESIRPTQEKVKAVLCAPTPKDKRQLKSFLGMINYYGKFLPNLSSVLHPLNNLLCKDKPWIWDSKCQNAYEEVKDMLASTAVLTHYDPAKPIQLGCDASPYGVGAVLSHIGPDGIRPIAYASRTLSSAERNYSQLEKEGLALVFAVKKFHAYIYGRHFQLLTDHKPLQFIFGPKRGIPTIAAARLQRWAVLLSAYDFSLEHRSSEDNVEPDCLSRLPLPSTEGEQHDDVGSFFHLWMDTLPVTCKDIAKETKRNPVLSTVMAYTLHGWPAHVTDKELKPFFQRRHELSVQQKCLLWGLRVIVPPTLRRKMLDELHNSHPGIVRMKELGRSYIWWPSIDVDIEEMARICNQCQQQRNNPCSAPVHPWVRPTKPWQRVHIDFMGPFMNKMFLILVDAHSKWPEVWEMSSTTSSATIQKLREAFSRYGLPETIVSDNGTQFTSEEFKSFVRANGIRHVLTAPYHPSTNGIAERFVQSLKQGLKKSNIHPLHLRLYNFLMTYRNTPHATTRECPATLMMGRRLRSRLDLVRPSLYSEVQHRQFKGAINRRARARTFNVGDTVLVRNFRGHPKWLRGVIVGQSGPVSFQVKVSSRTGVHVWRRHQDQLLTSGYHDQVQHQGSSANDLWWDSTGSSEPGPCNAPIERQAAVATRRYPQRQRRPPDFYRPT
ncbi:uncharacterized protein K02A2.6-like [Ornithodoros turicata]|uniref:uncharacterized protein K02A2.6-like n=1 Tax=Ornithodoros turicata TaxID=34597 RepID=UPI00313904ED